MKELHHIERIDHAKVLMKPLRVEILDRLRQPRACGQLAEELVLSPQRLNHHLRELHRAGLIEVVKETPKRHLIEKTYRSVAKAFWFSQNLARGLGEDREKLRERLSLHNLLHMSEQLQQDVAGLLDRVDAGEVPSIGVTAEIAFRDGGERKRFAQDYLRLMHQLLERYQGAGPETTAYKAMLICYPIPDKLNEERIGHD